jgi:ketosteroid isomerase-like protein
MSQENVEVVRRTTDAFNRGDRAAWLECFDPDAEMIPAREWPENALIRGPEAIWDTYADITEAWEVGSFELGEVIEAGPDNVIANSRRQARGRASGVDLIFDYWLLASCRNGKIIRAEWFADRSDALEAAGLSE